MEQFTVLGFSRNDGGVSAEVGERSLAGVDAQVSLLCFLIGAVAVVAAVGEDRADVAV